MPRTRLLKEGEGPAINRTERERYGLIVRPCTADVMDDFRAQANARAKMTQSEYLRAMLDLVSDMRAIAAGKEHATPAARAVITELLERRGLQSVTL